MGESGTLFFVTDIETNGPNPDRNSMLSFATVVVNEAGHNVGEYEAVLEARHGTSPDPDTMAWWENQPFAWAAATTNPLPPGKVMSEFADWVETFDGHRIFTARPLIFDGLWIDTGHFHYTDTRGMSGPFNGRKIFHGQGLDLASFLMGVYGRTTIHKEDDALPQSLLGEHEHTHRAIDDARGYSVLLRNLLEHAKLNSPHPHDFTRSQR